MPSYLLRSIDQDLNSPFEASTVSSTRDLSNTTTITLHDPTNLPHGHHLPSEYIWPEEHRPSSCLPQGPSQQLSSPNIHVVDLSKDSMPTVVEKVANACSSWGVFYVVNHGVPEQLIDRVRKLGAELFSLPAHQKVKAQKDSSTRGTCSLASLAGFGKPPIGKFFNSLMWLEGFTMLGYPSSNITSITSKIWQDGNENFRKAFEDFDMAMRGLAMSLVETVLAGLGVQDMQEFEQSNFNLDKGLHGALQMNYYPPCPQPTMTIGLPMHTDSSLLTILHQGDAPGLEIYNNRQWQPVPPVKNSFVIHVGDMLQVLSNGRYKSVVHRAVVNKAQARLSIAYMCLPSAEATIAPLPQAVQISSPPRMPLYKPLTWPKYYAARDKYFMDALNHFRLDIFQEL